MVRHAAGRGNKSVINVFEQNGKKESEEKVPYDELAIWTMEPSAIDFGNKKIHVAAKAAVKKSEKKTALMNLIVKLEKCRVSDSNFMPTLKKIVPEEDNEDDEIIFKSPAGETKTPKER